MRYLLLLRVPDEAEEYIKQIRRRFGFQGPKLRPHITLVPPFNTDLTRDQLISLLSNIDFPGFKQSLNGVGFFEKRNKVIYVDVVLNDFLMNLYLDIRNLLEPVSKRAYGKGALFRSEYKPHITIAKRLLNQDFLKAKSRLAEEELAIDWKVDCFWLYYFSTNNNRWEPLKCFKAS
jgi:2'-5' RNA ligase